MKILQILGFMVLISGLWIWIDRQDQDIKEDIRQNKFETIAKITNIERKRRGSRYSKTAYFKFRYHGKIYSSWQPMKYKDKTNIIGDYFVLHVSTKNLENNLLYFDKEVKDTSLTNKLNLDEPVKAIQLGGMKVLTNNNY